MMLSKCKTFGHSEFVFCTHIFTDLNILLTLFTSADRYLCARDVFDLDIGSEIVVFFGFIQMDG